MKSFIERHYRLLFGMLLASLVGAVFYAGVLEGRQTVASAVTLNCSEDVLKTLSTPLEALSKPKAAAAIESVVSSEDPDQAAAQPETASAQGMFLGSKNGTKYYTPDCSGAKRIKPENIIWFKNAEDATVQGYTRASAC